MVQTAPIDDVSLLQSNNGASRSTRHDRMTRVKADGHD
jgi:hypothetical protein